MVDTMAWTIPVVCRDPVQAFTKHAASKLNVEMAAIRPVSFFTQGNTTNNHSFDAAELSPFSGRTIRVRYVLQQTAPEDDPRWRTWYGGEG